ncbi:hypothetical protein MYX76_15600, partial [Desulfobacterota bacterium AH_259_B03_O07]|nr:hypothetical protein [Desulfobacterota bacterium AH_259_B03_O07]
MSASFAFPRLQSGQSAQDKSFFENNNFSVFSFKTHLTSFSESISDYYSSAQDIYKNFPLPSFDIGPFISFSHEVFDFYEKSTKSLGDAG